MARDSDLRRDEAIRTDKVNDTVNQSLRPINREQQLLAANRLEELAIVIKEYVLLLRSGVRSDLAYAMVYHLRHQTGQVVNALGVGVPSSRSMKAAEAIAIAQIGNTAGDR